MVWMNSTLFYSKSFAPGHNRDEPDLEVEAIRVFLLEGPVDEINYCNAGESPVPYHVIHRERSVL